MIKKIRVLLCAALIIAVSVLPASAKFYKAEMPKYTNVSGGAFFEIFDENLGTVTCLFPIEFKNDTFSFELSRNGVPANIVNVSNTTVNGTLFAENGTAYTCRASRLSPVEYRPLNSSNNYITLKPVIEGMENTNINFLIDDTEYANQNGSADINTLAAFLCLLDFFVLVIFFAVLFRR